MAIVKQSIPINFSSGINTKTDPNQIPIGQFAAMQNSVFTKAGLLAKRNGFASLTPLPNDTFQSLTTFNGNLTAIGSSLSAYASGSQTWVNTGTMQPMSLSVLPVVRSNTNQIQSDSVVSSNNLVCTAYADNNGTTTTLKYTVTDYITGQAIVPPTLIVSPGGTVIDSPRVFLLGTYFIIMFGALVSSTNHLQYVAVSTLTPSVPLTAVDISTQYTPFTTMPFDGSVSNNSLYIAWNASDNGEAIRVTRLDSNLNQHNTVIGPNTAGTFASFMSLAIDETGGTPVVWVYYYSTTSGGFAFALDQNLNTILTRQTLVASGAPNIVNIACAAENGILTVFYEVLNQYAANATVPTNFIKTNTLAQTGALGTPTVLVRSVGIASKAFILNSVPYFLSVYQSAFQPTYFLLNGVTGGVVAKLAYSNGAVNTTVTGGCLQTGVPNALVQADGKTVNISYLYKDLITSVNKDQGAANTAGIYSQTGVNVASFVFNTQSVTSEIGHNLNISGGKVWAYDGSVPVEQGFNVWPDSVATQALNTGGGMLAQNYFYAVTYEWTDAQGNIFRSAPSIPVEVSMTAGTALTPHGIFTIGASTMVVSSASNLFVGQIVTDTTTPSNINAGTFITAISGTTVTVSQPFAGGSASTPGDSLSITQRGSVGFAVPTLRITDKTANPVKIVIYRASTAQPSYFQVTSVASPVLNDTTVDSVAFSDKSSDYAIAGNALLYSPPPLPGAAPGTLENIGPPATNITTLFDSRLWLVDAEDTNLLWFSKQVIEGTPVEMSDLLTVFVAPNISAQGSTGPITALSAMDDKLIIFKKDAIYYLNGSGPDNTGSNSTYSQPIFVTSTVGCIDQNSVVFIPSGLMFSSDKGIWLLGRDLSTTYIGAPVEKYNNYTVESALNIPGTNQVRFTLSNSVTLMFDFYFMQWGVFSNIPAISSTLYQGLHTYLDSFSNVFQESPNIYVDGSNPVEQSVTTGWINAAGLQGYMRSFFFYLLGTYYSPHKILVQIAYDYNGSPTQSVVISPDNFAPNYGEGDSSTPYGQGSPYGGPGNVEQWRVFLTQQRCQAFQITITELYDSSFGVAPGAGFTLSGLNLIVGLKSKFVPFSAGKSVGGNS